MKQEEFVNLEDKSVGIKCRDLNFLQGKNILFENKRLNKIFLSTLIILSFFNITCLRKTDKDMKSENALSLNNVDNSVLHENQEGIKKKLEDKQRSVKILSDEYNFINLKEKQINDNEFELRIWSNIKFHYVKCFVLARLQNSWSASLYMPYLDDGEIRRTKNDKIVAQKIALQPRSGWEKLHEELKGKKMFDSLPFSLEKEFMFAGEDEGTIVLEIKQGNRYELVFYREFTKEKTGKQLFSLCEYLEKELNTKIGCGES